MIKPVFNDDKQQLESWYTHVFNDFEMMQEHVFDNIPKHESTEDNRFKRFTNMHMKYLGTINSSLNTIREKPIFNEKPYTSRIMYALIWFKLKGTTMILTHMATYPTNKNTKTNNKTIKLKSNLNPRFRI